MPRTLAVSIIAALLAVIGGTGVAFVAASSLRPTKTALTLVMITPVLMGLVVRNYAWVGLLSQLANEHRILLLDAFSTVLLYKLFGVIVVMATVFFAILLFARSASTGESTDGAATSSPNSRCNRHHDFFRIILPSIRNAQLLAYLLSSILAVGYFITPQLIGGGNVQFVGNGVLALLTYTGLTADASLLGLLLLLTALVPLLIIPFIVIVMRAKKERDLSIDVSTSTPTQAKGNVQQ